MTLPNFLIIGAPKAGTSSLHVYLEQHPDIYMSPVKEPHFFMLNNKPMNFEGPGDGNRFKLAVHRMDDYQNLFQGVTNEHAIGESSTTYLLSEQAPERIKKHIPEVKLIVILRNPVEAAYASFLHLLREADEPFKDFSRALKAEQSRSENNWEPLWKYTKRGFYYPQLNRYFNTFSRQQIKVYLFEEFKNNPQAVLNNIFEFLGVDETFSPDMSVRYNVSAMPRSQALNEAIFKPGLAKSTFRLICPPKIRHRITQQIKLWNYNGFQKPQMSEENEYYLKQLFREDILKLQDLIQKDLTHWLEEPVKAGTSES